MVCHQNIVLFLFLLLVLQATTGSIAADVTFQVCLAPVTWLLVHSIALMKRLNMEKNYWRSWIVSMGRHCSLLFWHFLLMVVHSANSTIPRMKLLHVLLRHWTPSTLAFYCMKVILYNLKLSTPPLWSSNSICGSSVCWWDLEVFWSLFYLLHWFSHFIPGTYCIIFFVLSELHFDSLQHQRLSSGLS